MIVVALILVAACAVVILGALFGDPSAVVELSFFDVGSADVTSVGAFLIGLATGAVTLLGLWLLYAAARRARHKSAERRTMEKRHDELEREKAELESKLGRDRQPTHMPPSQAAHADPGGRESYTRPTQPAPNPDPRVTPPPQTPPPQNRPPQNPDPR